jgi:lipoprotein NlpD
VRRGDSLYAIAWRYQLDYEDLIRWNDIASPDAIRPGQRLFIQQPRGWKPPPPLAAQVVSKPRDVAPKALGKIPAQRPRPMTAKPPSFDEKWVWPTEGKLVRMYVSKRADRRGVDIGGRIGQTIRAAASGQVVYSGDGLPAYGNLIIVKHDATYLSAYAYNRALLVREGEGVVSGQKIAEMGRNSENDSILHFEIRKNGDPVNPLLYLPRRD